MRKLEDWTRVVHNSDGRHGVVANYSNPLMMYLVAWDDGGWDYCELSELTKEERS